VDRCTRDVRCRYSSSPVWYKWVFSIALFQVLSSSTTKSTANDRWGEGQSNYPSCGYHAELLNSLARLDYTLFFRCPIPLSVILEKMLYILLWSKYWVYVNDIDMCCVLQGNKWGCDFNELVYSPRSHWPDDLQLLLSLDSNDLPWHYALHPLCQYGVPTRHGVVPSELGYGNFCGNIVGEDDAWLSSY
jgi:hypothetical protein